MLKIRAEPGFLNGHNMELSAPHDTTLICINTSDCYMKERDEGFDGCVYSGP